MPPSAPPAPQYATWHTIDHRLRVYFDQPVTLLEPIMYHRLRMHWNGHVWPASSAVAIDNYVSALCYSGLSTIKSNVCDYNAPSQWIRGTTGAIVANWSDLPVTLIP